MNRLFYGNFDFEEQLQGESRRPARVERLLTELAFSWLAVSDPEDRIWCPEPVDRQFLEELQARLRQYTDWSGVMEDQAAGQKHDLSKILVHDLKSIPSGMELVPWGWSPAAVEFGQRNRLSIDHPPLELVKLANSREFSVPRDGPPDDETEFGQLQRTLGQVIARVERVHTELSWVIKANWSHAARERIIGRGPRLSEADIAWVKQRLDRDGVVCWEPWLRRQEELGVQWEVTRKGHVQLIAVTELLVDVRGQYAGTYVPGNSDQHALTSSPASNGSGQCKAFHEEAISGTRPVIEELSRRGYFGPIGIDCMRYYDPEVGCDRLRLFQDINVRWTMGRIAAEWSRQLGGRPLLWWHAARSSAPDWAQSGKWIETTPASLGEKPVGHPTWLLLLS